jgi:large subunit ribosomal protein L4
MTATATQRVRTGAVVGHTIKKDRPALTTRSVTRRNAAGHDLGSVDLEPTIFGLEPNRAVLHQVVTAQLAASRAGTQSTKTRAEVRGGGAKPFRQKGTGRARQGSSRSPSMSGGGVALGPKPRSYAQRTPKKMVRLALLSALSDRAEIARIALIDDWQIEAPKTKDAATILRKLKLAGTVLVVLAQDELDVERSFANLPQVQTTTFGELSAHDVLRADWLLFSDRTLPTAVSDFSGTHVAADAEPEAEESAEGAESAEVSVKAEKAAAVVADAEEIDDTAPKAEAAEAAPAKPRARAAKRAEAVPEPEATTPTESGTEEADADA